MGACDLDSGENATVTGAGTPASPWSVAETPGVWSTTLPSPVFASGLTLGASTISARWRERRSSDGQLLMDYTGLLTLSGATVGAMNLRVPNSRVVAFAQHQMQMHYLDAGTSFPGWWLATANGTTISLRISPSGVTSATAPFTWANGDVVRWGIRGLVVSG